MKAQEKPEPISRPVSRRDLSQCLCRRCSGLGVRYYSTSRTWRGVGPLDAITSDVCDLCWGSGFHERPWPSHRQFHKQEARIRALEGQIQNLKREAAHETP